MKKLLLFLMCCFISETHAQNPQHEIDSIKTLLKAATHDTTRIRLVAEVGNFSHNYNPEFWDSIKTVAERENLIYPKALALGYLGVIRQKKGDLAGALNLFNDAYEHYKILNHKYGISTSLTNIGHLEYLSGDYHSGIKKMQEALQLRIELKYRDAIANTAYNLGLAYESLGDHELAMRHYKLARVNLNKPSDRIYLGYVYNSMGLLYHRTMIKDSALKYLEKSVDVNVETGNLRSLSTAYNNLCLYYYYQKDTAKAIEYSRKSLSTRYKAKDTPGLIYSLSNMARLFLSYKIARQDSIIYYVSEAEKHARLVNTPRELKMTAMYLSEIWSLNNNADSAIKYMNRIKVLLDDMLRLNYYILGEKEKEQYYATLQGDYGVIYKTTAHFHKERPWLTDTAYNTVLRNKGLTLQSSTFIRQAIYNSNDSSLKSDYEKWIQLKKEIAALYMRGKDISKQDSIVRVQERTLIKRLNIEPARRVNWKEVQAALKPGEAAVEFIRHIQGIDIQYEYKYAAMMIKPGLEHPLFIPLCVEDTLRDILSRLKMNSLSEQRHLKALYKEVWEPLETHLSGIKTVFVSPEGLLHRVSYAALPVEKDILLCDKYQIRNRPSTGRIALQKNIAPDNFETLLFGGVDYGNPTDKESIWSYLPGTMTEVQSIEKQLLKAGKKVEKATGTSADEITFKQKSAQAEIIHLASHGFFYPDPENKKFKEEKEVEVTEQMNFRSTRSYGEMNFVYSTNPLMRTGIAMSGANKGWSAAASPENDGVLTAAEISHLNLQKSKLVVLSACETGLGEIVDNEGVFGLQRAFLLAGTDALIMSLWQVPDKETSEFMTLFYKNLLKKKEIHTAFLLTQKSMRKKYPALYWAGFILLE